MKKIGIIGGGFSGTMTAVHLIRNAIEPIEISIINEKETFNKGIAFNPYSKKHLLNVITCKMSAFADHPEHFLEWVMQQEYYSDKDKNIVANSFLPRKLYGEYVVAIWEETIHSEKASKVKVNVIDAVTTALEITESSVLIHLNTNEKIVTDICIITSGNQVPRNPNILNKDFFKSGNYFQNPWDIKSVTNIHSSLPVLIIGNGLTMVDTVIGLQENKIENKIISLSPNGFHILPHQYNGLKYTKLIEELPENASLPELVQLFNKHIKIVKEFGLSAEVIIDSIRDYTPIIWQRMTTLEKRWFMSRLRHLWGVGRHRIPLHIYNEIQQLRSDNHLRVYTGNLIDIKEEGIIRVKFYNKTEQSQQEINVSRVINCTGPESDLLRLENNFLKNCLLKGIMTQDELKLGINADPITYQVIDKNGNKHDHLFTVGSTLKGIFWESIAVKELRQQAEKLAEHILGLPH